MILIITNSTKKLPDLDLLYLPSHLKLIRILLKELHFGIRKLKLKSSQKYLFYLTGLTSRCMGQIYLKALNRVDSH